MDYKNEMTTIPLRPCLCSTGELYGGVERQLLGLCSYWLRNNVNPLMILFHDRELAVQVRELGIEPYIIRGLNRYDPRCALSIARILKEYNINIVHAHGYKAIVNCGLAYSRYKYKSVVTVHGLIEPSGIDPIAWLKSRGNRYFESQVAQSVGSVICYVTGELQRKYQAIHRNLSRHVVYNGIDPLNVSAVEVPIEYSSEMFEVAIVGRVTEVKGIIYAIKALEGEDVPSKVRLNVLGTGPLLGKLHEEVDSMGLAQRIRFLGFRRNIYNYIGHCDALLVPSLHEGLPYTLLEGMSLARPIIASAVGGLAEILQHRKTALLCEPRDVIGIRRSICDLVTSRDYAYRLGQAARHEQVTKFSLNNMGNSYKAIYENALSKCFEK